MSHLSDNERWIVNAGEAVLEKRARGVDLFPIERLVYCLWVADYGMRNAGDLSTANDLHPEFQREGAQLARELGLPITQESFSLPVETLEMEYGERFDHMCAELRKVPDAPV